jgi:DNA-binding helix-hairpin-helix protein with protein kinase domain
MSVFDEAGRAWDLGPKIAAGGEGVVHQLLRAPDYCAKVYHTAPLSTVKQAKLKALCGLPKELRETLALPLSLIFSQKHGGQAIGVILPFVNGHDIFELYNPQSRREHFQKADFAFLVEAARNLSIAFKVLHENGIVMGDVNEQNIKVRPDATLSLIDCDSFQIERHGQRYHCNVGTPLWTPPELQGVSLAELERTPNHDAFGLAQLIFLLLFAGRYPFAGRPLTNEPFPPEAAIAKFAFAFDPTPQERLLEPPPSAPPFKSLPPALRNLFLRAFRRGSQLPGARPSPGEWITELKALRESLRQCPASSAHLHWKGSEGCPWCDILQTARLELFPAPVGALPKRQDVPDPLEAWVARLFAVTFEPLQFGLPSAALQTAAANALDLEMKSWMPGFLRQIPFLQKNLNATHLSGLKTRLTQASQTLSHFSNQASTLFLQHFAYAQPFLKSAHETAAKLKNIGSPNSKASAQGLAEHRAQALQRHLERQLLYRAQVAGLGQSRLATLQSYHVITAWDVTEAALMALPGFGMTLTRKILEWRRLHEQDFHRSYRAPTSISNDASLTAAAQREAAGLIADAKLLLERINEAQAGYDSSFEALKATYHNAYARWSALETRIKQLSAMP